jgi:EmrB/QacA subfamily drug resistance transporter
MPDNGKIALFIAILAGFLTPFDLSAVNIALPTIGEEFAMDAVTLGWVATAYLLASAVFLLPFGRLADIHGRKKIFSLGLAIFTLASFLLLFASTATEIVLLRILQGAGASLIFGTAVAILTSVTPAAERGRVLGIYTTSVYLGLSAGPFIGGWLVHFFGWRSIFLINVPIGLFTLALILLYLDGEWADATGEPFDLGGSVQYGLTLICVMLGFTLLPDREGFILLVAGTLMLVVFINRERRIRYPVLDLLLWTKNPVFAFSNLAAFINYSATISVTFILSLNHQNVRGFDAWIAGAILVVQPVAQAAVSPLAGRLSDRIEPGRVASAGMALTAAGLAALVFVGAATPIPVIAAILVLIGLGLGIFSSPNTNAIMGSVEKRMYGTAAGTLSTMRLLGQTMSMGLAMMIIALVIGRIPITSARHLQLVESMRLAFALFCIFCIAGILYSLVRCSGDGDESGQTPRPGGPR